MAMNKADGCLTGHTSGSSNLDAAVALFHSLSDSARLAIVRRLADGEARVVDLIGELGLAQSTVSAHVACLRDCGLVTGRPEGRQVFYFTAQAEEVAKWRRLADDHPDVDCRFVGLPDASALVAIDLEATPTAETTRRVPEADGLSMDAYADAVGVAPWSGWDALDALHLWYLLDTPAELEACLRRGYATWGQLRAAVERGKHVPLADVGHARERARAIAAWQAAWRQGRGRRVDRAVLDASGAVSSAFIDDVTALCGDCDGDAEALVACLQNGDVQRFQSRQVERLETFLLEEGYLTPDDRLSDDEIRRRVAEAGPPDALDDALAVLARIRQRNDAVAA